MFSFSDSMYKVTPLEFQEENFLVILKSA